MNNSAKQEKTIVSRWGNPVADDRGFVTIPGWILRNYHHCKASPLEMMFVTHVMSFKFDHAEGQPENTAKPSLATIAIYMGRDIKNVRRLKQSLIKKHLLDVTSRPGNCDEYDFGGLANQCLAYELDGQKRPQEGRPTPPKIAPPTPPNFGSTPLPILGDEDQEETENSKNKEVIAANAAPDGFAWFMSDWDKNQMHLLRNSKGRPLCGISPFRYPTSEKIKLADCTPCAECLRRADASRGAVRRPSSNLTDAMWSAIPERIRPPGKPFYGKNSAAADVLHTAGFTPERVAAYVKDAYESDTWLQGTKDGQIKIITMYQVMEKIKAYELSHGVTDGQTTGAVDVSGASAGGAREDGTVTRAASKFIPAPDGERDNSAPPGWTGSRSA